MAGSLQTLAGDWSWKRTFFASLPATPQVVAKANPQRWTLSFVVQTGAPVVAPWAPDTTLTYDGFSLNAGSGFTIFKYADHGGMVQGEWQGFSPGLGSNLLVVELIWMG